MATTMATHTDSGVQSGSTCHRVDALQRVRAGEESRLGGLLELYRNYLSLLATGQIDRKLRGRISASDLVQETMMEAHRDFHQFRGSTEPEFIAWLRRILVNNMARAIEMHVLAEKRDVRREVSIEKLKVSVERSTVQLGLAFAGREETPSVKLQQHERAVDLANQMSRLSAEHREVLMLRNLQSLPFKEVAERMDRSVPAAKMLWMRAIKKLRESYDEAQAESIGEVFNE